MLLSHAHALLDSRNPLIESFQPQQDDAALSRLAEWATRFSPSVALDPPDGLLIDITGCQRYFGGAQSLLQRIGQAVKQLGFQVQLALAPTFGCAWAVARFGNADCTIVPPGHVPATLNLLPVCALRIDEPVEAALVEVGIEQIGHLLTIPRSQLAERFGEQVLLPLDKALGHAIETIVPVRPQPQLQLQRIFDGPCKQWDAIEAATQALLAKLCEQLQHRESGVLRVQLEFERADMENTGFMVVLARPNRHVEHLWSLIRPKLERIHLGFGVEQLTLRVGHDSRLPHQQNSFWQYCPDDPNDRGDRQFNELIDLMVNRLGHDRVIQIEPVESHIPEQVWRRRSVLQTGPTQHQQQDAALTSADRPPLLLSMPEPIEVVSLQTEGPPLQLSRHGHSGTLLTSFGPERIEPQWWVRQAQLCSTDTRDYFKVQDDQGTWLWIYRELKTGRWFVHGEWT